VQLWNDSAFDLWGLRADEVENQNFLSLDMGLPVEPLRDAVSAFLDGTELGEAVRARVTEELSVTDDVDWSPEDRVAFGELAEEIAWLTVDPGQDEDETPDDIGDMLADDDPAGVPLRAFAADLSTPAALAASALAWHEHIHYGLWRIDDPVPGPGLRCIDIISGTERYVEFPAEATTGLPRWTVWLGGMVPVDGIWRSTGLGSDSARRRQTQRPSPSMRPPWRCSMRSRANLRPRPRLSRSAMPSRTAYTPMTRNRYRPRW